MYFKETNRTL